VLVADFGGGTTDYSVIAFDKGAHGLKADALGHAGVGVAGDRFDYRIIDHVILPQLGKGTTYRSMGKRLELPRSCFSSFASWHELSVMKTSRAFKELKEVAVFSDAPELVGASSGSWSPTRAIRSTRRSRKRRRRSRATRPPRFTFAERRRGHRQHDLARRLRDLDRARAGGDRGRAGRGARQRVRVGARRGPRVPDRRAAPSCPAVRRIFERRFGADRVDAGNEFVSIANGLATIALREDVDEWVVDPGTPAR
jgi:hypothetical chaperone protein